MQRLQTQPHKRCFPPNMRLFYLPRLWDNRSHLLHTAIFHCILLKSEWAGGWENVRMWMFGGMSAQKNPFKDTVKTHTYPYTNTERRIWASARDLAAFWWSLVLHCQFDRIGYGANLIAQVVSVRMFLRRFNWDGTYSKCGQHHPTEWDPGLN